MKVGRTVRLVGSLLLVALLGRHGVADDTTAELLRAPRVAHHVALRPVNGALKFGIDSNYSPPRDVRLYSHFVSEAKTFAAVGDVRLGLADFNPLTMDLEVKWEEKEDPNLQQLRGIFGDFVKLPLAMGLEGEARQSLVAIGKDLEKTPPTAKGSSGAGSSTELGKAVSAFGDVLVRKTTLDPAQVCAESAKEEGAVAAARCAAALIVSPEGILSPSTVVDDWVEDAVGRGGVDAVAKLVTKKAQAVASVIARATARLERLEELALEADDSDAATDASKGEKPEARKPAETVSPKDVARVLFLSLHAREALDQRRKVVATLEILAERLTELTKDKYWMDGTDLLELVDRAELSKGNQLTARVVVTPHRIRAKEDGLEDEPGTPMGAAAVFRDSSVVVPEVAGGLIYSRIAVPKYTLARETRTAGGQTTTVNVIALESVDEEKFAGAALANLVLDIGRSTVYPMVQIGVSVTESNPAILVGGGLRFTYPIPVGITVGFVPYARVRDLKTKRVGDEVADQAELEKSIGLVTAPVKLYVALQMAF